MHKDYLNDFEEMHSPQQHTVKPGDIIIIVDDEKNEEKKFVLNQELKLEPIESVYWEDWTMYQQTKRAFEQAIKEGKDDVAEQLQTLMEEYEKLFGN